MTHPSIKFRCSFQRDPWGHHWLAPWWLQFQPRSLLTGSGNGHRNDHIFQGTCYVFSFRFIFWFWKNTRINTSSLFWLEQVEVWLWLMLTVISMMPAQSSVAEKRHHGKHPPALWWIMDHKTRKKTLQPPDDISTSIHLYSWKNEGWTPLQYDFWLMYIPSFFWCLWRLKVSFPPRPGIVFQSAFQDHGQVRIAFWSFKLYWWYSTLRWPKCFFCMLKNFRNHSFMLCSLFQVVLVRPIAFVVNVGPSYIWTWAQTESEVWVLVPRLFIQVLVFNFCLPSNGCKAIRSKPFLILMFNFYERFCNKINMLLFFLIALLCFTIYHIFILPHIPLLWARSKSLCVDRPRCRWIVREREIPPVWCEAVSLEFHIEPETD